MEAYLSGEKTFVKPHFSRARLTADSVDSLPLLPPILRKSFARSGFLPHYLKCGFIIHG
ncbi:DUF5951 family protein [Kosakonia sp.]|uniref:DUF5951 family protein n=1 Tax=Kosakonia sp. TaxID=1916651 RepID=UPI00390CBC59